MPGPIVDICFSLTVTDADLTRCRTNRMADAGLKMRVDEIRKNRRVHWPMGSEKELARWCRKLWLVMDVIALNLEERGEEARGGAGSGERVHKSLHKSYVRISISLSGR